MKKPNIVFYCSWGGYGHVARVYPIISNLPAEGKYTVATPEDWPFEKPNKNFTHEKIHRPKSRIRFKGEDIIVQNYEKDANDTKGYNEHLHAYISVLERERPDLVVVDNAAEVAIFSKILGYKTVVMYETLDTDDLRWRLAWSNTDLVLSPYPKSFLEKINFPYIKNSYCAGGFTRFEGKKEVEETTSAKAREKLGLDTDKFIILISVGKGETAKHLVRKMITGLKSVKGDQILLLYPNPDDELKSIIKEDERMKIVSGVYDEIYLYLRAVDVIVTGAGYNSVMEAISFGKPTVAIPLDVLFNEQIFKAKVLSELGAL